jgi:hypothetical protein
MSERTRFRLRLGLFLLTAEGLVIGVHALFFPHYFYEKFFLGAGWLTKLGPYSEHLTRDAGALYLGLTVVTVYAMVKLSPDLVYAAAAANAVAAFPHMVFHFAHTQESGGLATVPQAGTLLLTVLLSIGLIFVARTGEKEAAGTARTRPGVGVPAASER